MIGPAHAITHEVAAAFGVNAKEILGDGRSARVSHARFAAAWLVRRRLGYSLPRIGAVLNRDHSTIKHAIRRCDELSETDADFRFVFKALTRGSRPCCPHCGGQIA